MAENVGAPPGYIGYEEGGQLTEPVRRKPYSVVLFDEIEKAHPDVFNVLLQILDDGRLTDSQGRTVSFRNVVVIMTSNVGSQYLSQLEEGDDFDQAAERVREELKEKFKPEFLNRVDDTVVFRPLGRDALRKIVDIQLDRLKRLLHAQRIELTVTDGAKDLLAKEGFDPVYGARPLKRVIARRLQDELAVRILEGNYAEGDTIIVDAKGGEIVFTKANGSTRDPASLH